MRPILTSLLCLLALSATAQDPQLSQPYGAPLYLNPAFAGYEGCSRVALSYRNQWPGLDGNFQSVFASYDQYVHPLRGGIGVNAQYHHDGEGIHSGALSVAYSPTFGLFNRKVRLSPALEAGWRARDVYSIHPAYNGCFGYYPGDTLDYVGHDFDMSAGFILSHHGLTYGLSIHHLTEPDEGYGGTSHLPRRFTGHIAYSTKVHEKVRIMASTIYVHQMDYQVFWPSFMVNAFGARLGCGFQASPTNFDSVILQAGYARKWFSIGYSYDITVSSLGNSATGGSHEVNLQFRFNCKNKERGQKGDSLWGM